MTDMKCPDQAALTSVIGDALRGVLAQQGKSVPASIGADTALFGAAGLLDSMGLVTLVVEVEQHLADQFGWLVTLADDRAMSQRNSPFRSVGALADYIHALPGADDAR